jgi:hypothetical protein
MMVANTPRTTGKSMIAAKTPRRQEERQNIRRAPAVEIVADAPPQSRISGRAERSVMGSCCSRRLGVLAARSGLKV